MVPDKTTYNQSGFSRFELAVVVCLFAAILGVGLGYFQRLLSAAERAAVEQDLGALRSALGLQVLKMISSDPAHMVQLLDQNPVEWLQQPPQRYLGEVPDFDSIDTPEQGWYYLVESNSLIYVIRHHEDVMISIDGPKRLRFKLVPIFTDMNSNGRFDRKIDRLAAVQLLAQENYIWLEKKSF